MHRRKITNIKKNSCDIMRVKNRVFLFSLPPEVGGGGRGPDPKTRVGGPNFQCGRAEKKFRAGGPTDPPLVVLAQAVGGGDGHNTREIHKKKFPRPSCLRREPSPWAGQAKPQPPLGGIGWTRVKSKMLAPPAPPLGWGRDMHQAKAQGCGGGVVMHRRKITNIKKNLAIS